MLWTEKYRPRRLDDLIGNDAAIAEVRKWALLWKAGKPQKPLLLVGPPGVGKTATAYALAEEMGWDLVEMNASDVRDAKSVERVLGSASQSVSFSGARKLVLIDEVDGIQGNYDRGGVSAVLKVLRSAKNPVILTANDEYARPVVQIKGLCKVVKYKRVNYRTLAAYLAKILEREGIPYDQSALLELAKRESGDVRSALLDIQAIAERGGRIDKTAVSLVGYRDRETNIFEVLRTIFKSERVIRPFSLTANLDMDPDMLTAWIVENIPREYEDPEEIADAFHWASRSDVFRGRIIRRQYWGFLSYALELLIDGAIVAKKRVYRKFTPYQFPTWVRQQAKYKQKRQTIKKLFQKLGPVLHVSLHEFRRDVLPLLPLLFSNRTWAAHLVAYARLTEDDVAFILDKSPHSAEVESIMKEAERVRERILRSKLQRQAVKQTRKQPTDQKKEQNTEQQDQGKQVTLFDYFGR
ncbi:MAG: replication factor C large subunit [Candidatus Diapherotrites archaeon]|nr:replication factor C large subunit [Candidatus Diapherotrites archaeon]